MVKNPKLLLIAIALIGTGCFPITITNIENGEYIYDKTYISKILIKDKAGKITDSIKINHYFSVEIHGFLPEICWNIHKIDVVESKNEFQITPIARRKKDALCAQVLKSFTTQVAIPCKSTADTIRLLIVGKNEKISKTIKVIY